MSSSSSSKSTSCSSCTKRKILVLHGNRQTGELFLGRIEKLRRKLNTNRQHPNNRKGNHDPKAKPGKSSSKNSNRRNISYELVAPDAPFVWSPATLTPANKDGDPHKINDNDKINDDHMGDVPMRTWWNRNESEYVGLEESLQMLHSIWCGSGNNDNSNEQRFEGIIGFSQGARLAHLISHLHETSNGKLFPGLKYCIMASGYDAPVPTIFSSLEEQHRLSIFLNKLGMSATSEEEERFDFGSETAVIHRTKSLHVIGRRDKLVPPDLSRAVLGKYNDPVVHEHDGGHHLPMKGGDVDVYLKFIAEHSLRSDDDNNSNNDKTVQSSSSLSSKNNNSTSKNKSSQKNTTHFANEKLPLKPKLPVPSVAVVEIPDEEHALEQTEECEALSLIYPNEFQLLSKLKPSDNDDDDDDDPQNKYEYPIEYKIILHDPEDDNIDDSDAALWPTKKIALRIKYTATYPDASPTIALDHDMNMLEFGIFTERTCLDAVRAAADAEVGMPCAMSCVLAAKEFFENGGLSLSDRDVQGDAAATVDREGLHSNTNHVDAGVTSSSGLTEPNIPSSSSPEVGYLLGTPQNSERMKACDLEGQAISNSILKISFSDVFDATTTLTKMDVINAESQDVSSSASTPAVAVAVDTQINGNGGGSWKYTIGLVGKPSAGKSTFFNAASAFARQRGGDENGEAGVSFGASMAPHPFTTIDPNVGFCFVPAPFGSCPEDSVSAASSKSNISTATVGSTHGRDSNGRRLLPVMLKDVAGLVPGAYQGRGRGNKFLDDLTDADVLIHVVDASGTADAEGNSVGEDGGIHPLEDLAWVRNELIEWVCFNLASKWDSIKKRGRNKLVGMFSGYKQNEAFVWNVLTSLEKYMEEHCSDDGRRDHNALDHLEEWDGGDLRRLVSAFLGARFPMALALNKSDLPTATQYVKDIHQALPIHGAHVGVPLSARDEMNFVRMHVVDSPATAAAIPKKQPSSKNKKDECHSTRPDGVWKCLQSAISLREPILVFPVYDMVTYEPLPGMFNYATRDASLPNSGMIKCLQSAGGHAPTMWDDDRSMYQHSSDGRTIESSSKLSRRQEQQQALRDVIVMKPGSTVYDVFRSLKNMNALRGEFVRAEGAGQIGEKPRLIPKYEKMGKTNRIIKIMTNKRI